MEFRILGPLQVHADAEPLPVRGLREQKILAVLLLNPDRLVPLERLVKSVWDDNSPATAGTQVRNRISGLRRAWSAAVPRPEAVLTTESSGYLLRLDGHALDAVDYERDVAAARDTLRAGDLPEAVRLLRSALGHWRGPALTGIGGKAIEAAAARLEEHRLSVTEECLGHELTLGRHDQVVGEVAALAEAHPFRERLAHHLMLALYRSRRQADALAHYQRYTRVLRDELGLDPGAELRTLHEAILRRSPTIDTPAAEQRLDPASTTAMSASSEVVPPPRRVSPGVGQAPVVTRPAELPADVVDFTGRAREIATLDELLPDGDERGRGVRIIAVTGTAGVGKTHCPKDLVG